MKKTKTPARIQRKRTKGWQMPIYAKYVGRPTKWGNPYPITEKTKAGRLSAVARYGRWLNEHPEIKEAARIELRGWNLVCWCPLGADCHADILLKIANEKD